MFTAFDRDVGGDRFVVAYLTTQVYWAFNNVVRAIRKRKSTVLIVSWTKSLYVGLKNLRRLDRIQLVIGTNYIVLLKGYVDTSKELFSSFH